MIIQSDENNGKQSTTEMYDRLGCVPGSPSLSCRLLLPANFIIIFITNPFPDHCFLWPPNSIRPPTRWRLQFLFVPKLATHPVPDFGSQSVRFLAVRSRKTTRFCLFIWTDFAGANLFYESVYAGGQVEHKTLRVMMMMMTMAKTCPSGGQKGSFNSRNRSEKRETAN